MNVDGSVNKGKNWNRIANNQRVRIVACRAGWRGWTVGWTLVPLGWIVSKDEKCSGAKSLPLPQFVATQTDNATAHTFHTSPPLTSSLFTPLSSSNSKLLSPPYRFAQTSGNLSAKIPQSLIVTTWRLLVCVPVCFKSHYMCCMSYVNSIRFDIYCIFTPYASHFTA